MIALTIAVQIIQIWDGTRIYVVILGFKYLQNKKIVERSCKQYQNKEEL